MIRISKSFLALMLALMLLVTVIPIAGAQTEEAVNLITDENNVLRDGVFLYSNATTFSEQYAAYYLSNAFDGSEKSSWLSKKVSYMPYLQINFPVAQQISQIRVKPSKVSNYDTHKDFEIRVSNDYDFADYEVVQSFKKADWGTDDFSWKTVDVEDTTEYKYVQLYWKGTDKWAALAEIQILGYLKETPPVDESDEATAIVDVCASASSYDGNYIAQKAIDGDESTQFYASAEGSKNYIQIDLKRETDIDRIDFKAIADVSATNEMFNISVSNEPTFITKKQIYYRDHNDISKEEYTHVYGIDDTKYRYIRFTKNEATDLGFTEIKVWGNADEKATVLNIASGSLAEGSESADDISYLSDGLYDESWTSEAENAYVIFTFEEPVIVTSVAVFSMAEDVVYRSNFNIYGSQSGDFEDADLIGSVDEEGIEKAAFESFDIDAIKLLKAVKIEKTDISPLSLSEVRIIHDSSDTKVEVEATSPVDTETGVTNIDGVHRLVEVDLNRTINEETITPDNIIITNLTDNEVLENWEAYSVEGKRFTIDISYFKSNKEYQITLTQGVTANDIPMTDEYSFTFTTGKIVDTPYVPNKIIKNVALNKKVTGNPHASYGKLEYMVDSSTSTYVHTQAQRTPSLQLDLGNLYDVVAFEINGHSYTDGLEIRASNGNIAATDMTNVLARVSGNAKQTLIVSPASRVRYIGLTRGDTTYTVIYDFKVYAIVSEDFGTWSVKKNGAGISEITDTGTYDFSIPVTNYTDEDRTYYMLVGAYDASGVMVGLVCDKVTSLEGTLSTLSASITIDERAVKVKALVIKGIDNISMLADMKTIEKPAASETE